MKTMRLYALLARHYDEIFPLDYETVAFVRSSAPASAVTALDVGCATGLLARDLAGNGWSVTGIDSEDTMVRLALKQAEGAPGAERLRFLKGDMRELDTQFPAHSFDLVLCLGNSLVHLPDAPAVRQFLERTLSVLTPAGRLLIQIMNYDKILSGDVRPFAPVDIRTLLFERAYAPRPDGRLDFLVRLTEKKSGVAHADSLPLYPVTKYALEVFLADAGFTAVEFFGDFRGRPWTPDGRLLVVRAG